MHILSPEIDTCPSWISGRERMAIENISWWNPHERMLPTRRGSNPQPPDHQLDAHHTEPPRPADRLKIPLRGMNTFPGWANSVKIVKGLLCRERIIYLSVFPFDAENLMWIWLYQFLFTHLLSENQGLKGLHPISAQHIVNNTVSLPNHTFTWQA